MTGAEAARREGGKGLAPKEQGVTRSGGDAVIHRARLLDFLREPAGHDDLAACRYEEDGALLVKGGGILARGSFDEIRRAHPDLPVEDHRPLLLLPGFIDTHIHYPQMQVIASWGTELLDWLSRYTFPEECRFADPVHAARIARTFFDETLRHGTTTTVAFCTSHPESAEAFFAEAERRGVRALGGKVLMDRGAPPPLLDTPERAFEESRALIERWHGRGRLGYVVTPRFALTSTPAQLDVAAALMTLRSDLWLQTHLSENHAEIETARRLFPDATDYFDIYQRHGLTGSRSLFGHCLHLSERERRAMAETGSVAVFCPTSNLFLGSGLYDNEGLKAAGVRRAIATDVGGGTSFSLLRTLDEGYKVLALRGQRLSPLAAFWWITRGNAEALDLAKRIGTLEPGSEADFVLLDSRATELMALRMERAESLSEELFVLQTLGDERAVAATYVAGERVCFASDTATS